MPIPLDDAYWLLVRLGRCPVAHIGSGMEGHVFDVGSDSVAKVWFSKTPDEIVPLQSFYEIVHGLHLPFDTPLITEVHDSPDGTVSIERALQGTPLNDVVFRDANVPPSFATNALMSVLTALRDHPVQDTWCALPILGVRHPEAATLNGSTSALLDVVSRNVDRYGDQLRRSVPDFDWVYAQTVQQVRQFSDAKLHAVHGDLCPPNILLGPDLNVTAVLDWGFLSHFGDTSLDASIACGSYNLYGEHSRVNDAYLVAECVDRHGYDHHRLLVYRALYAVLTSNAYSEDGTDGHYAWCVDNLNRDDIQAALSDAL